MRKSRTYEVALWERTRLLLYKRSFSVSPIDCQMPGTDQLEIKKAASEVDNGVDWEAAELLRFLVLTKNWKKGRGLYYHTVR